MIIQIVERAHPIVHGLEPSRHLWGVRGRNRTSTRTGILRAGGGNSGTWGQAGGQRPELEAIYVILKSLSLIPCVIRCNQRILGLESTPSFYSYHSGKCTEDTHRRKKTRQVALHVAQVHEIIDLNDGRGRGWGGGARWGRRGGSRSTRTRW